MILHRVPGKIDGRVERSGQQKHAGICKNFSVNCCCVLFLFVSVCFLGFFFFDFPGGLERCDW